MLIFLSGLKSPHGPEEDKQVVNIDLSYRNIKYYYAGICSSFSRLTRDNYHL